MARSRLARSRPLVLASLAAATLIPMTGFASQADPSERSPRQPSTQRVSLADDGSQPSAGFSYGPSAPVSADGRYVAFASSAESLVPGEANGFIDVFLRDVVAGRTSVVSVSSDETAGNQSSFDPALSHDGRYVAFASTANTLVPGDTNASSEPNAAGTNIRYRAGLDVFVRDVVDGTTERVSVSSAGVEGNWDSRYPSISGDGRFVAFESNASNLVPGDTNRSVPETLLQQAAAPETGLINETRGVDIFVHDRDTGETERVSVASDGSEAVFGSFRPAISADGRFVAFQSLSPDLVQGDTNGEVDIFVHDRLTDVTERVSVGAGGIQANGPAQEPSITADGRFVAFSSRASNLVSGDTNGAGPDTLAGSFDGSDVFVHDRLTARTERVSVHSAGWEANGGSYNPHISADGRTVVFASGAGNLVPDFNDQTDAFAYDRETGTVSRISVATDGTEANGTASSPAVGPNGEVFTFLSSASTLVDGDTNGLSDVFLRDAGPGLGVTAMSATPAGDGQVEVRGTVAATGGELAAFTDPAGDATRSIGPDLTGATIAYRPDDAEAVLTVEVADLSPVSPAGPKTHVAPGASLEMQTIGVSFETGGVRFEAFSEMRSDRPGSAQFVLAKCEPTCETFAGYRGSYGTTGEEIRLNLPLSYVGAQEDTTFTNVVAFARDGETTIDESPLQDFSIPRLTVGVAGASPAYSAATITGRSFSATIPDSSRIVARACLGARCGHPVTIRP